MDFQYDSTTDGRRLKFLYVIDEHSRLRLAIRVAMRCKARDVLVVLEELISIYSPPSFIRSDNGPEFIAQALRKCCDACDTTSTPTSSLDPRGRMDSRIPSTRGSGTST